MEQRYNSLHHPCPTAAVYIMYLESTARTFGYHSWGWDYAVHSLHSEKGNLIRSRLLDLQRHVLKFYMQVLNPTPQNPYRASSFHQTNPEATKPQPLRPPTSRPR
jgi:hypothetical protein